MFFNDQEWIKSLTATLDANLLGDFDRTLAFLQTIFKIVAANNSGLSPQTSAFLQQRAAGTSVQLALADPRRSLISEVVPAEIQPEQETTLVSTVLGTVLEGAKQGAQKFLEEGADKAVANAPPGARFALGLAKFAIRTPGFLGKGVGLTWA